MSVFDQRHELIEHFEFKLGRERGRLAAAQDLLSDLAVILGSHAAYCRVERGTTRTPADLQAALRNVEHVKELVASLLHRTSDHAANDD